MESLAVPRNCCVNCRTPFFSPCLVRVQVRARLWVQFNVNQQKISNKIYTSLPAAINPNILTHINCKTDKNIFLENPEVTSKIACSYLIDIAINFDWPTGLHFDHVTIIKSHVRNQANRQKMTELLDVTFQIRILLLIMIYHYSVYQKRITQYLCFYKPQLL